MLARIHTRIRKMGYSENGVGPRNVSFIRYIDKTYNSRVTPSVRWRQSPLITLGQRGRIRLNCRDI